MEAARETEYLIFCELDFFFRLGVVKTDGVFIYTFNLPAFLGIDPGVGLGFVSSAHTAHD